MSERTDLIKARREAEDNLVKTIVQLSATLIVLLAGFLTQTSVRIYSGNSWMLAVVVLLLIFSLVAGLSEHIFSSKAYLAQQILVEKFYNKEINDFSEPSANRWVRRFQVSAFIFFVGSLSILGFFAFSQMRDKIYEQATATATAPESDERRPRLRDTTIKHRHAQPPLRCLRLHQRRGEKVEACATLEATISLYLLGG